MLFRNKLQDFCFGISFVNALSNNKELIKYNKNVGEFIELVVKIECSKYIFIDFDLDYHILSVELGEEGRKNRIKIFSRNFNGEMYIFFKNLTNLKSDYLDFYTDYYNNLVISNDTISKEIIGDINNVLRCIEISPEKLYFVDSVDQTITLIKNQGDFVPWINVIKGCISKNNWNKLINKDSVKKIYDNPLTVLPPDIRPDTNNEYMILQIITGCKVMETRGKPCGFCSAYENIKCNEYKLDKILYQIDCLCKEFPKKMKKINKLFLSDGDALRMSIIIECMQVVRKKLNKNIFFESFVSTATILSFDDKMWSKLKKNGLSAVYWGVESAFDEILKLLDKPQNLKMLLKAKKILEHNNINYYIIAMAGVGKIGKKINNEWVFPKMLHAKFTSEFINESDCKGVYISKLQIIADTYLGKCQSEGNLRSMEEEEIDSEYREMIKMIKKNVKGSYGNQFVVQKEKGILNV